MSMFPSREDLVVSLGPISAANRAQTALVAKAWDKMMSSLPSDGTLALSQSTHQSKGRDDAGKTPSGANNSDMTVVNAQLLRRFSTECNVFTKVVVTAVSPASRAASPSPPPTATTSPSGSATTRLKVPPPPSEPTFVLMLPSHEQLYFLRLLFACCIPREDMIGPSTTVSTSRLGAGIVETLMALLQLLPPSAVVDDIRTVCTAGEMVLTCVGNTNDMAPPAATTAAASAVASPTAPPALQLGAGASSAASTGDDVMDAFNTAMAALEVFQQPHVRWRAPRPLTWSEISEKSGGGGFFGKLFRVGGGGGASSSEPSAGAGAPNSSGNGAATASAPEEPAVDLRVVVAQQQYLLASPWEKGLPSSSSSSLYASRGGDEATIGDFFAMALCLKSVPLTTHFMTAPSNAHPMLNVEPATSTTASDAVASGIVGYSAAQMQPVALLAQTIVALCVGVAPAHVLPSAYTVKSSPSQGDINMFTTQSLTSTASVALATGQRAVVPHGFSLPTVPAAYSSALLATALPSGYIKAKASGLRGLDSLLVYDQSQVGELRVSDVVAVSALTAVSLLQSLSIVPVQVTTGSLLAAPSLTMSGAAGGTSASSSAAGGATSAGGGAQQAGSMPQHTTDPSVAAGGGGGVNANNGGAASSANTNGGGGGIVTMAVVASNPPPALGVALSTLQSALASPTQYARASVRAVQRRDGATTTAAANGNAAPHSSSVDTIVVPSYGGACAVASAEGAPQPTGQASSKATVMRTNLLFLVATCAHRFSTGKGAHSSASVGGEAGAANGGRASASPSAMIAFARAAHSRAAGAGGVGGVDIPLALRTSQRFLDGFRCVYIGALRLLALHGATRSLLRTVAVAMESLVNPSPSADGGMDGIRLVDGSGDDQGNVGDAATSLSRTYALSVAGAGSSGGNAGNGSDSATRRRSAPHVDPNGATSGSGSPSLNAAGSPVVPRIDVEEDVTAVDFQSSILSALLSIFVNCGPAVRAEGIVLATVKRLVFPMLMETSLRQEAALHRVSFSLYSALRRDFRGGPMTLVDENGSFFNHVIFFLLESKHAKVPHKRLVLQLLMQVAEEPRDLVELFLNYDCDRSANNVFETMMRILAKLTCGTSRPALPLLNAPTSLKFGVGGIPPPPTAAEASSKTSAALPPPLLSPPTSPPPHHLQGNNSAAGVSSPAAAAIGSAASLAASFPAVGLPSRFSQDSLYDDALSVVLMLPNAVRQWIERFEDALKLKEMDEQKERRERVGGDGGLRAAEEALKGLDGKADSNTNHRALSTSSDFLEHHRIKRLVASFFELFNVNEKPNDAIALITSGKIPLAVVEGEIAEAVRANGDVLSQYLVMERLTTPEEEEGRRGEHEEGEHRAEGSDAASATTSATTSTINHSRLVARFLHAHCDAVDKIVLGEYFSKMGRKEDIKRVFHEWVSLHDFVKMKHSPSHGATVVVDPATITTDDVALPIDEALRVFLGGFKLLGEAQVVDRTMELFAGYYCDSVKAAVAAVEQRWAAAKAAAAAHGGTAAVVSASDTAQLVSSSHLLSTSQFSDGGEPSSSDVDGGGMSKVCSYTALQSDSTLEGGPASAALTSGGGEVPTASDGGGEVTAATKHPLLVAEQEHQQQANAAQHEATASGEAIAPTTCAATEGNSAAATDSPLDGDHPIDASADHADRDASASPSPTNLYVLNQNTAFILAFSICMLNTDAHSAHVKDKMGQRQFVRNNSGIDDGKDVPADLLSAVYTRVFNKEIVLRPTNRLPSTSPQMVAQLAAKGSSTAPTTKSGNVFTSALMMPLGLVYGAVKLPFDVAGELVFNTSALDRQRQQERESRQEMQMALTAALGQLRSDGSRATGGGGGSTARSIEAGLEHAIPMWESCVDLVVTSMAMALAGECAPTDYDTEHSDSPHAQWLLGVAQDAFAVCVTFGFHEHVSIIASLLKQLSLVGEVIDPKLPLEGCGDGALPERPTTNASGGIYTLGKQQARGQKGCVVSRPIAIRNLRCAYALLDCVSAHRGRVTSVIVWRHCYSILSRLELINDKLYWSAAEEEVSANAQAQLQNARDGANHWLNRLRTDLTKAATSVGGMITNPNALLENILAGATGAAGRHDMLDISYRTIGGITDPIVKALTLRNAIRRAMARVRAEHTSSSEYSAASAAAGSGGTDCATAYPSFYTFTPPRGTASASVADSGAPDAFPDGSNDDDDEDSASGGGSSAGAKVAFAQQAAMIIAVTREAEAEMLLESRTHLLKHLATLLGESLAIAPKLQWNELWKRVSSTVFLSGGTHRSARVAMDVVGAALYPLALKFFLQHGHAAGDAAGSPSASPSASPSGTGNKKGDSSSSPHRHNTSLFQQDILRPFYTILTTNRDLTVQAVLLDCINTLVAKAHDCIAPSTGWPVIFSIINTSATMSHLIPHGWKLFRSILQQYPLDALCTVRAGDRLVTGGPSSPPTSASSAADANSAARRQPSNCETPSAAESANNRSHHSNTNNGSSSSSGNVVTELFDLKVFETGIIYTLTSFACQSDDSIACEALLWLETCADAAQHGLAVFTATTQSPNSNIHRAATATAGSAYRHSRTFSAAGGAAFPSVVDPSVVASSGGGSRSAHQPMEGVGSGPVNDINLDILMYVPLAPLSVEAPLRLRQAGAKLGATTGGAAASTPVPAVSVPAVVSVPLSTATTPLRPSAKARCSFEDHNHADGEDSKADGGESSGSDSDDGGDGDCDPMAALRSTIKSLTAVAAAHSRIPLVWQCLLECVAPIISIHGALSVRCVAISCFFSILAKYGHLMDGAYVWDSIIWEACRSALVGHILSQGTMRRVLQLATVMGSSVRGMGGASLNANTVADAIGLEADGREGRDLPWSDVLCYLFLREAVTSTLECEGRMIREGAHCALAQQPTCASSNPLCTKGNGGSHNGAGAAAISFYTNQRIRVGRWRNRLLAVVSEKCLTELKFMRRIADPFADHLSGVLSPEEMMMLSGGEADPAMGDDPQDISRVGCSSIADIVLNVIGTIYLPHYTDGKAHCVASSVAEVLDAHCAAGSHGAAMPSSFLKFVVDNLSSIADAVSVGVATPSAASSSSSGKDPSPQYHQPQWLQQQHSKRFTSMLQRPLFVELFLKRFLCNILPRAFERMQDVRRVVAMSSAVEGDGAVDGLPTFVGPVASHSRSSFLCMAGDGQLRGMLGMCPSRNGTSGAAVGVSGGGVVHAPSPSAAGAAASPTGAGSTPPASPLLVAPSAMPRLIGIEHYAVAVQPRPQSAMSPPRGGGSGPPLSFGALLDAHRPKWDARDKAHHHNQHHQHHQHRMDSFGIAAAAAVATKLPPSLASCLAACVGASFYVPPPKITALATVADAAVSASLAAAADSNGATDNKATLGGGPLLAPPASASGGNVSATIATWRDLSTRVLGNGLWRAYWQTTGSSFAATNALPPLSNGLPSASPRCLHCRCDCHNRASHNISCAPLANTIASMNALPKRGGGGSSGVNPHTLKCCCPCVLSHTDSSYVLTGVSIAALVEQAYCASMGNTASPEEGVTSPLLCRHITPAADVVGATRCVTTELVTFMLTGAYPPPSLSAAGGSAIPTPSRSDGPPTARGPSPYAAVYGAMAAIARSALADVLSMTRAAVRAMPSPSAAAQQHHNSIGSAIISAAADVLPTDGLSPLSAGAALVCGTLWHMAVQHRVGFAKVSEAVVVAPPLLSIVPSSAKGDAFGEGSSGAAAAAASSPSPLRDDAFATSLLAALSEDLSLVASHVTTISRWVVAYVVASAEPSASASTVTATAKAAEEALIRRTGASLADALYSGQAANPSTLFGLWAVSGEGGDMSAMMQPSTMHASSAAAFGSVVNNSSLVPPPAGGGGGGGSSSSASFAARLAVRNFLVVQRAVLLLSLRQVLEACPTANHGMAALLPLLAVIPSQQEELPMLSSAAARKLRASLANRLQVAVRRQGRGGDAALLPQPRRRVGTRPFRDVCTGVAFYITAHTPTGLAADSDDSEADMADPNTPTVGGGGGVGPAAVGAGDSAGVSLGDVALSSLFGTLNPPIVEPRNAVAVTPPPARVAAWLRERCGIRSDAAVPSSSAAAATTNVGLAKATPMSLVRVATSGALWEDMLMHLSVLPMAPPHCSAEATSPQSVPFLTYPTTSLLQHYLNRTATVNQQQGPAAGVGGGDAVGGGRGGFGGASSGDEGMAPSLCDSIGVSLRT